MWIWSFNSLDQDPYLVAAFMMSTCNGGTFTMKSLPTGSMYYPGPSPKDDADYNLCMCTTIVYSLRSACGGCQGGTWIPWSEYKLRCAETPPAPSFPNAVPVGTRVPPWALLDVANDNNWDRHKSYAAGDTPECPKHLQHLECLERLKCLKRPRLWQFCPKYRHAYTYGGT
ncbi:hypothetical protein DFH94DRAFT_481874 [Russula ochroleuca]|uniref:Uncharacterized protein n=1 Tax=Russula ochroleuca TaxID=152965 RepID=A0A9P5MK92_9AGAM|nr:hypothetical protein DFH94DRAFT_481874 [Russula ochroleuca]